MRAWAPQRKARERLAREAVLPGAGFRGPGAIRACLLYPNTYFVGMSNLGFQTMHRVMNATPGLSCERAFLPDAGLRGLKQHPPLTSLETQSRLAEFDVVGVSVSYEMDYAHVVAALAAGGIPARSRDRSERHPLVIGGGPCITYNPEPLAEFLDACVIGEGEEAIGEIAAVLREVSMARGASRQEVLEALARVPGVYAPACHHPGTPPVRRRWVGNLDAYPAATFILTPETQFGDLLCVEISRGCGRGCRFCVAGYVTRPPRHRSRDSILETIRSGLSHRRKVGLVGASISDYPDLPGLLDAIAGLGVTVSASSLRADVLLSSPALSLAGSGETAVTLAPEAGSERLRHAINKSLTDAAIDAAAENAVAAGIRRVKLYLMVGLPTETEADVDAAAKMCRRIAEIPGMRQVQVSINPFVPKPGTPFQWCGMAPEQVLQARIKRFRAMVGGHARVEVDGESPRASLIQGALARGGRELAPVIQAAAEGMSWNAAFRQAGFDPEALATQELPVGAPLPWSAVDPGFGAGYLERELEATRRADAHARGGLTPPCAVGRCRRCQVCPPGAGRD